MDSLLMCSFAQQNKYAESYEKKEATTLSKEEEEACLAAMAIATGNAAFKVLKAVIELGVLEILKNDGLSTYMSTTEIANHLSTTNPNAASMLECMLCHLAGYSPPSYSRRTLPDGQVERLYGLAWVTKYLTNYKDRFSFAPFFTLIQDKVFGEGCDYARICYDFDAHMLMLQSGKERTAGEHEALAKQSGFEDFRVACSAPYIGVMEFIKKY
ncbi:hypothetical protein Ancab_017110 [Ancistrocladus abbreviatus]